MYSMTDVKACYDYSELEHDLQYLRNEYPFLETGDAGNSCQGRRLHYIRVGSGPSEVFYNGAHHSNEWITSMLLSSFVKNFMKHYSQGLRIRGYDIVNIFERCSIYIIPMVNPDGVEFVLNGTGLSDEVTSSDNRISDRSIWKANSRGVDLNLNYPAGWEKAKEYERFFDAANPSPSRHAGAHPLSESETQAVAAFTKKHDFKMVIAYHTQGKEIFWRFDGHEPPCSKSIADLFASVSGYTVSETAPEDSYAGYKDWFIREFNRPGFTIEAGIGSNPLPVGQFPAIYEENEEIMLMAPLLSLGL